MSTTSSQKMMHHRLPSASPVKQGPIKATIPMASVFRQQYSTSSGPTLMPGLRRSNADSPVLSPSSSPHHQWRIVSPEFTGYRSPGSTSLKSKSQMYNDRWTSYRHANIRRTASLDAIYVKGQGPKDCYLMYTNNGLQLNKATQTDENLIKWSSGRSSSENVTTGSGQMSEDKMKILRHRLQRNAKEGAKDRVAALPADHNVALPLSTYSQTCTTPTSGLQFNKLSPVNIPKPSKPPMRSSIEGLNQEIERLVLRSCSNNLSPVDKKDDDLKFHQSTPEGHRAPLADLLQSSSGTRSVNTQTPVKGDFLTSNNSSGESQRSTPEFELSKLGTSPHINRFWAREPPDGCERVNSRIVDDPSCKFSDITRPTSIMTDLCPSKPCVGFQLRPSLGSAFYALPSSVTSVTSPLSPISPPILTNVGSPVRIVTDSSTSPCPLGTIMKKSPWSPALSADTYCDTTPPEVPQPCNVATPPRVTHQD